MTTLINDIKFGLRKLAKSPGFTCVAVLTLALGIGANTAIFSIFEQVLLRALPVKDPDSLVMLVAEGKYIGSSWGSRKLSYQMFKDFQDRKEVFEEVMCRRGEVVAMNDGSGAERVETELASAGYFEMLGVQAALGRTFVAEDETAPGANPVIVLSHDFWQSRFAGDPNIVGHTLLINDSPMVVVGVAEPKFKGISLDSRPKLFIPITMKVQVTPSWHTLGDSRTRWVEVFARLKPGISRNQALAYAQIHYRQIIEHEAETMISEGVSADDREQFLQSRMVLLPASRGHSFISSTLSTHLHLLMGLAGLVLLVACANISNLLIIRATSSQKETTIRLAMGASRLCIVRQMLTESMLLAFAGGLAALLVSNWTTHAIMLLAPGQLKAAFSTGINGRMLVFNIIISAAAAFLFGLLPAWRAAQIDLVSRLKDQAASVIGSRKARLRQAIVIVQVCLSLILLVGSGLLIRSLLALYKQDPGFKTTNLVCFKMDPTQSGYKGQRRIQFCRRLKEQLQSVPGIESVALAHVGVFEGQGWINGIVVEGYQAKENEDVAAVFNSVSRDYCKTLGVPVKLGREFNETDELPGAKQVVLVNEAFVKWFLPDRNPLGYHLGIRWSPDAKPDREIIGIVQDSKSTSLQQKIEPLVIAPHSQIGISYMTVFVRTSLPSMQVFKVIRERVHAIDTSIPIFGMNTVENQLDKSLTNERLIGFLSSLFGMLATILSTIGLYGVTAYSVARREKEIGIRIALGARKMNVLALVVREGMILTGIGVGVGLLAALWLTRILRSFLFGIEPHDPVTMVSASMLMITIAALAAWIPARRAAKIDPMEALRYE